MKSEKAKVKRQKTEGKRKKAKIRREYKTECLNMELLIFRIII